MDTPKISKLLHLIAARSSVYTPGFYWEVEVK